MPRFVRTVALMTVLLFVVAIALAATDVQSQPEPAGVAVSNTEDGHVRVSWDGDYAPVHRVGWATMLMQQSPMWLATASKRANSPTPSGTPTTRSNTCLQSKKFWVIVGAGNERFGAAT